MVQSSYYWDSGLFASVALDVDVTKPSIDLLGEVRSHDFVAEYQASDANIKRGGLLIVNGELFEVKTPPMAMDNGDFKQAELMKIANVLPAFDPLVVPWDVEGEGFQRTAFQGPA
ncbi:hypothetical protein [Limnobacter sp.]|uniref:hypothetical protein n=1 Tax=Limnobacter sp. TaxID=2003368 RepID=UPI002737648B|nr:hypothetical protein [Limnobacter sp.]